MRQTQVGRQRLQLVVGEIQFLQLLQSAQEAEVQVLGEQLQPRQAEVGTEQVGSGWQVGLLPHPNLPRSPQKGFQPCFSCAHSLPF